MDTLISNWQEYSALGIVAVTVVLMVRSELRQRKNKKDCSNCALVEIRSRQRYSLRK
ncbi:MAG: hypothetical protein WCW40_03350 [Bacteroidota bacterium]